MCGMHQRGRNVADKKAEQAETIYNIEIPQTKIFNKSTGEWDLQPRYNTPQWVRYHETLSLVDGKGTTADPYVALELLDMGASVTPDPRPLLQEKHAQWLKQESDANPLKLAELAQFLNESNAWRAAHGVKPIDIPVPQVPRAVSALVMPIAQVG